MIVLSLLNICFSLTEASIMNVGFSQNILDALKSRFDSIIQNDLINQPLFDNRTFNFFQGAFRINFIVKEPVPVAVRLDTADTVFTLQPPNIFHLGVSHLTSSIEFDWVYQTLINYETGSGLMEIYDSTFSSNLSLIGQSNGTLNIVPKNTSFVIQNYNLVLFNHRDNSNLLIFLSYFRQVMKLTIQNLMIDYFENELIGEYNTYFGSLNMTKYINNGLSFYYGLSTNPVATSYGLQFNLQGVYFNPNVTSLTPNLTGNVVIPNFKTTSSTMQTYISEYTLNTFTNVLFTNGFFYKMFDSQNTGISITTSTLNSILPGIEDTFTPDQPCSITCSAKNYPFSRLKAPSFKYMNGVIITSYYSECNVTVLSVNQLAITMDLYIQANSTAQITNWVLYGNISDAEVFNIKVVQNNIGSQPINIQGMTDFLNLVANLTVPYVNQKYLYNGIELPNIPHLDIDTSELNLYDGYLSILSYPSIK